VIVVSGWRLAVASETNRPVIADWLTVPPDFLPPTVWVTVVRGDRVVAPDETKRPVRLDLLTERVI